jgi:hypothetical protein
MTNADLVTCYRAYLDALNERRLDDLVHHVQDEFSYNGETMTRRQYLDLIAADITGIPDSDRARGDCAPGGAGPLLPLGCRAGVAAGINALALFGTAMMAGMRVSRAVASKVEAAEPVAAPASG